MILHTTTATEAGIYSALLPYKNTSPTTTSLDGSLSAIGDIKTLGEAGDWWDLFLDWLADLIDAIGDLWDDIMDQIKAKLDELNGLPWYWMPPVLPPENMTPECVA